MNSHPWVKSYPPGVRWDAPLELSSVQSVLERSAQRFGPLPALQFMDKRISYAELDALANRAAAGFQKLGVGPGVHVGLFLPNTPHYVIAFFGVMKAGGVVVNFSPLDALRTLEHKIGDSETDILVSVDLAALYPHAESLLATTRLKKLVVGEFAEFALAPDPIRAHMAAAGQLSEVRYDDRHVAFRDLIDNDGRYEVHPLGDLTEALAVIQYTGGTTGAPKGAMLTHANLSAACGQYLFRMITGVKVTIVTFRTTPDLMTAILRGDINVGFDYYAAFRPMITSKQIKIIATSGEHAIASTFRRSHGEG